MNKLIVLLLVMSACSSIPPNHKPTGYDRDRTKSDKEIRPRNRILKWRP